MSIANLLQVLVGSYVFSASGSTLRWKTVQRWIAENADPGRINQGYASFNANSVNMQNAYVELRRSGVPGKRVTLTASVVFDKRQGPSVTMTWRGSAMDSELERMFGKNLRTRVQI